MKTTTDSVESLAMEFRALQESLNKLTPSDEGAEQWEGVAGPLRARLAVIAHAMVVLPASSARELALKAGVVLDWIDTSSTDIPNLLSASLCRDVVMLFPTEDAAS